MTKLPKQFKLWLKENNLQPEGNCKSAYRRRVFSTYPPYLIGNNRRWRYQATETGYHLQVSCPLDHFDRWANSAGESVPIPETKQEFDKAIQFLIQSSQDLK